jgi:hypothetical protein
VSPFFTNSQSQHCENCQIFPNGTPRFENCVECTETQCNACISSQNLKIQPDQSCKLGCPPNHSTQGTSIRCVKCLDPNCESCPVSVQDCQKCFDPSPSYTNNYLSLNKKSCLANCPTLIKENAPLASNSVTSVPIPIPAKGVLQVMRSFPTTPAVPSVQKEL